jgi:hypothetical protein
MQDRAGHAVELGKLFAVARAGRQPDPDVTVAQLLDQYVSTAGWTCPQPSAAAGDLHGGL